LKVDQCFVLKFIAKGTSFDHFVRALGNGSVVYDPGIKIEGASTLNPRPKLRSQFRTTSRELGSLYDELLDISLVSDA